MDILRKNSSFQIFKFYSVQSIVHIKTINLSFCWARKDKYLVSYALLKKWSLSRYGPIISIFQFPEKLIKKFFWTIDSYVKKSEKNIGTKIFTLSLVVLPEFVYKDLIFSYMRLPPPKNLILRILEKWLQIE